MGRTCGTCGAAVPILLDACPACGADPELQLVDVGALAPLGRRSRPPSAPSPSDPIPGRRRRSRWPVAAIVAVVVVVVAVLASAPEDDGGEAAAEPEPARTTTTTALGRDGLDRPSTTTFAERPPASLPATDLYVAGLGGPVVLHLDSGHELPVRAPALGAHDGRLLVDTGAGLAWWPPPFDGTRAELLVEGVSGHAAWVDPVDGGVWVLAEDGGIRLRFVAPDGSVPVDRRFEGPLAWPLGVAAGRLVLDAPGGTFVLGRDGSTELLSTGSAIAAGGDSVAVTLCDDRLVCRLEVLGPSGAPMRLPTLADGSIGLGVLSSTGLLATVAYGPDGVESVQVGGEVVIVDPQPYVGSMAWSPDGRFLLVGTEDRILVLDMATLVVHEVAVSSANLQTSSLLVFDAG